jgi:hypothetical protein
LALTEWAFGCPHTQTLETSLLFLAAGSEHLVYFDPENQDVLKITKTGTYGAYYELGDARVYEFKCTPDDYLNRMRLLLKHFGFSQTPLGVTGKGQIVSHQKFVAGDPPTQEAVDSFLLNAGLNPVRQSCWLWKGLDSDGFEPWVGDARADNFVDTSKGIIPIDLRMWHVAKR